MPGKVTYGDGFSRFFLWVHPCRILDMTQALKGVFFCRFTKIQVVQGILNQLGYRKSVQRTNVEERHGTQRTMKSLGKNFILSHLGMEKKHLGVSKNNGTLKWMIYNGTL